MSKEMKLVENRWLWGLPKVVWKLNDRTGRQAWFLQFQAQALSCTWIATCTYWRYRWTRASLTPWMLAIWLPNSGMLPSSLLLSTPRGCCCGTSPKQWQPLTPCPSPSPCSSEISRGMDYGFVTAILDSHSFAWYIICAQNPLLKEA